ncbi:MAG: CHAD domain-containing protein, partial [Myxococcota bacterium]|nr:CHAD domain-containing protein [Myxococcota bacterium]
ASLVRRLRAGELERGDKLLDALLTFRVKPSRDRRLAKLASAAVEKARRGVERRRNAPLDDSDSLHRLRIAYKRLRYTVEAFGEALGPETRALAHSSSRFQKQLGAIHDVDVALGFVRRARVLSQPAKDELLVALGRERDRWEAAYKSELKRSPSADQLTPSAGTRSGRSRPAE